VLTRRSAEHARRQQLGEHGTAVDARTKNEVDQAFSAESHRQFCHNRLRSKISRSYSTIYNLTPAKLAHQKFDLVFLGDICSPALDLGRRTDQIRVPDLESVHLHCHGLIENFLDLIHPCRGSKARRAPLVAPPTLAWLRVVISSLTTASSGSPRGRRLNVTESAE
jgi:hypothetical protein